MAGKPCDFSALWRLDECVAAGGTPLDKVVDSMRPTAILATMRTASAPPTTLPSFAQVGPEEVLSWKKDGVQNRVLQRLKKGAYPISGTLDLHGRTVAQAQEDMLGCIAAAAAEGRRCLLIVHGKSASAAAPARLKNCVNAWLRQHPQVNAFHSARPQHGGAGALYVLIGKRSP